MTDTETEVRADGSVEPHRKRCFPAKQVEDRPYSALHFLVGVENDLVAIE